MAPELKHHLARVMIAIRAAEARPSVAEIAEAPILERWRVLISPQGTPVIWGQVSGHPRLDDTMISTSRLIALNQRAGWARSISRWFRLGKPVAGDGMHGPPLTTLSQAKRQAHASEFGDFIALDDMGVLRRILADFIARAREEAAAQGIGGRDGNV